MGNQVNISTGIVNTTVSNTLYSDNQLAVYQVDKVLLPPDIFRPSAPAPAPAKSKKKSSSPSDGPSSTPAKDTPQNSASVSLNIWTSSSLAALSSFLCYWIAL
ncbi:hypothetical protein J5N97_014817 [Dioscorea zingiberensis]|uniref:Uncharacterized protein n=1 Tax=Dioscorea zingiberensis TaxID=325984 RepID=A0A9D5CVV9_9LILI|nr:hypothetical protein J5N97_014817 [Dioscorea zingiberensis]